MNGLMKLFEGRCRPAPADKVCFKGHAQFEVFSRKTETWGLADCPDCKRKHIDYMHMAEILFATEKAIAHSPWIKKQIEDGYAWQKAQRDAELEQKAEKKTVASVPSYGFTDEDEI